MRVVDIPGAVKVDMPGLTEPKEVTFQEFVAGALDQYEEMGKGIKQVRQAVKLHTILDGINGEKNVQFEDADFEVVKAAVEKAGMIPKAARQMVAFYEAVEGAEQVKPPAKK